MTAKKLFFSYILFSMILAWYFTSIYSAGAMFGYDTLVNQVVLLRAVGYLILGLIFFLIGTHTSKYVFKDVRLYKIKKLRLQKNTTIPSWQNYSLVIIFAIYSYLFVSSFLEGNFIDEFSGRIFEHKLSAFTLIFLAYLGYLSTQYKRAFIVKLLIILISLFVSVVDASRSGVIPLIGIFFGEVLMKKRLLASLIFYLIAFGIAYSIGARNLYNRLSYDVISTYLFPDFDVIFELIRVSCDYFFAFSVLNFSYMSFVLMPEFSLTQILISINPLPSFIVGDDMIDLIKLTGDVRAIGGPAELLLAGPAYFISGFFLIGVLAGYVDTIIKSRFNFILWIGFFLMTIVFFQYSLRTSARIFEVIFFMTFILRWKLQKIEKIN